MKENKMKNIIVIVILLWIIMTISGVILKRVGNNTKENLSNFELIKQLDFEDSVYNYIQELNIKHPDVVFRQARIESGNFTSRVFKDNNNMFGFKQAYKRPNTQIGVNRGYAVYANWQECVIDYALYQTYSAKNLSKEDYINFLGKYYAEDPEYTKKIE